MTQSKDELFCRAGAVIHWVSATPTPTIPTPSPTSESRRGRYAAYAYIAIGTARADTVGRWPHRASTAPKAYTAQKETVGYRRRKSSGAPMRTPATVGRNGLRSKTESTPKNTMTAAITPSTSVGCLWSHTYTRVTTRAYEIPEILPMRRRAEL